MNEATQISYGKGIVTVVMNSDSETEVAAPNIRFGDYQKAVQATFSEKELETISSGASARMKLDFVMVEELEDKGLESLIKDAINEAEATKGTLHEGMYYEVTATKSINSEQEIPFDSFSEDVEIQVDVPLYLIAQDRDYYLIKSYMGVCELVEDVDHEADTLSVDVHDLSTILMVYQDRSEALTQNPVKTHIKPQYLFIGAIVLLVAIWWHIDRRTNRKNQD
ncbi:hypothetical protein [Butyrivibrio sp. AE2032]|uniref:hypothetical protein n=1 Tax=Butyrivibrio sp. AE2032 TaxID=1458463 RepID=UPI00054D8CFF|nr:hypothetical protein [Butyrivibrio sp. AE2032]